MIKAFQNVADALRALQSDADLVHEQNDAERSASDSYTLARTQFRDGAINYLTLLNADRTWQQAQSQPCAGAGTAVFRYCRAVPGTGRRMVASHRCRAGKEWSRPAGRAGAFSLSALMGRETETRR